MPEFQVRELDSLLATHFGESIDVLEQKSKYLTAPGEHYGSIMLAMDITFKKSSTNKEETLHLVAKMLPVSEMLRISFDVEVTFRKEMFAYIETIPALIRFQRDYNIKEEKLINIFAECYGARLGLQGDQLDDDAVLLFENLQLEGYKTVDRFVGFDLAHAKMIIKDLAQFHAVPIALRILRPNDYDKYIKPCVVPNSGIENTPPEVMQAFVDSIIETSKTIPDLKPYIESIIEKVNAAKNDNCAVTTNPIFNTAVHSDYWVNNTMVLQDDEGKPIRNKMVDLQIMHEGSALRDVVFFLFTSIINETLDEHYDELLRLYYDTFIGYLKDFPIDLEPFSYKVFLNEMDAVAELEFFHITLMLKPIFTEKGSIKDISDVTTSDWASNERLGPAHRKKLHDTVISYAKRNWI